VRGARAVDGERRLARRLFEAFRCADDFAQVNVDLAAAARGARKLIR